MPRHFRFNGFVCWLFGLLESPWAGHFRSTTPFIQSQFRTSAKFPWRRTKELVKRRCPRPKQHLQQQKAPPVKQQTLNTVCTDPRHQQQVSSKKPGFTSQTSTWATQTLIVPSAYEISGFCKERAINRCCCIWLLAWWGKQWEPASSAGTTAPCLFPHSVISPLLKELESLQKRNDIISKNVLKPTWDCQEEHSAQCLRQKTHLHPNTLSLVGKIHM